MAQKSMPQWASILSIILMVFTICLGMFLVSQAMIPALVWGAILAVALRPIQKYLLKYMGYTLSSTLIVGVLIIIALSSISLMSWRIADEMTDLSHNLISDTVAVPDIHQLPKIIANNERIKTFFNEHTHTDGHHTYLTISHIQKTVTPFTGRISGHIMSSVHAVSEVLETLSFTFIALFCYLSSYDKITKRILIAGQKLLGRQDVIIHVVHSVRGTVSGLVLVGIGEGIIISPAFFFGHTPHPAIMTVLISIAAMIPFVGPPVAIIASLMTYSVAGMTSSIIVATVSLIVLFSGDHFVRPIFIGGATKLPFLATLIGILGGMHAFGFIGLFVGPSIMAAGHMLWCELTDKTGCSHDKI